MLCCMELSCAGNDSDKIWRISDDIQKLEKGESRTSLPANFVERLQELVLTYDSGGKGVISVKIDRFRLTQALPILLSAGAVTQYSPVTPILQCMLDREGWISLGT